MNHSILATSRNLALCASLLTAVTVNAQAPHWTPPAPLNSYHAVDSGANEVQPRLATDHNGKWVSIWVNEHAVLSATSTDAAATWTSPETIFEIPNGRFIIDCTLDYAGNGTWVAQWIQSYTSFPFPAVPIHYVSRSFDGVNWEAARALGSPITIDSDSDSSGTIITSTGYELFRSTDFGETWTSATTGAMPPAGRIEDPQVAYAGAGKWYHIVPGASYDTQPETPFAKIYTSVDGGATWSAPQDRPQVAALMALAARGNTLVASNYPSIVTSTDGGLTWVGFLQNYVKEVEQDIAVNDSGTWIVTASGTRFLPGPVPSGEDILIVKSADPASDWKGEPLFSTITFVTSDPQDDTAPSIDMDNSGRAVIVYQGRARSTVRPGPESDIFSISSLDSGTTWSEAQYVDPAAADDFPRINDSRVSLASGDNGAVVAVWAADTSIHPFPQDPEHVMFARSSDYGATWTNSAPITPPYTDQRPRIDDLPTVVYAGEGRWLAWWGTTDTQFTNSYALSNDNGFTWGAITILYGDLVAGSGTGTAIKVHDANGGNFGFARLPRNAEFWEEPFIVPDRILSVTHSAGANWFAISADRDLYVSTDDGRTWALTAGTNVPPPYAKMDSDGTGVVNALYSITQGSVAEKRIVTTRSTDNGVTWSAPVAITDIIVASGSNGFFDSWADIASAGSNKWVAVWDNQGEFGPLSHPLGARMDYIVSHDGGQTWSAPRRVTPEGQWLPLTGQRFPSLAAAAGKAVVAWDAHHAIEDVDIYYNFGLLDPPPTAAGDWQLFE